MISFDISQEYQNIKPYPYIYQDNFLNEDFAFNIQKEILDIPDSEWDRYENPFESKYTLRNNVTNRRRIEYKTDRLFTLPLGYMEE